MNDQQRIETAADNCEVLRARLAKYEDAEGNPIAQPSGVVLPERKQESPSWGYDMGGNYDEGHADGFNACLDEVARLNSSPVSAGEYGDAYQGAREDLAIWKRRALEAESKIREQDQIIDNLGNALNDENGPTFMGEPVIRAGGVDERVAFEAAYSGEYGTPVSVLRLLREGDAYIEKPQHSDRLNSSWWMWKQARACLSAPSHGEQVREVPEGEPDWPDYHHNGMGCGLEDRGITDRYEAMQHGWDDAFERCVIAFNDWLAAAPSAGSQEQG